MQAVSLVALFASLGFRLSERSDGSGSGGSTEDFRQQLTHILTSPHASQEVRVPALQLCVATEGSDMWFTNRLMISALPWQGTL